MHIYIKIHYVYIYIVNKEELVSPLSETNPQTSLVVGLLLYMDLYEVFQFLSHRIL